MNSCLAAVNPQCETMLPDTCSARKVTQPTQISYANPLLATPTNLIRGEQSSI